MRIEELIMKYDQYKYMKQEPEKCRLAHQCTRLNTLLDEVYAELNEMAVILDRLRGVALR